jgi:hypothetical protein
MSPLAINNHNNVLMSSLAGYLNRMRNGKLNQNDHLQRSQNAGVAIAEVQMGKALPMTMRIVTNESHSNKTGFFNMITRFFRNLFSFGL